MAPSFRVDKASGLAWFDSEAYAVTPREADVLECLGTNAGRIVSRREFERTVWRFRPGVRSEVVPVTLRRLRAKLGAHGPLLVTLKGRGWRLDVRDPYEDASETSYFARPAIEEAVRSGLEGGGVTTLVGPHGAGKTRIAVAVAQDHAGSVIWVDAGSIRDRDTLAQTIAARAGLQSSQLPEIATMLGSRERPLIVVDDLAPGRRGVADVLAELPATVLITSTAPTRATGEARVRVDGLSEPAATAFLAARLAEAPWNHTETAETMARVVAWSDGLPLALEMAAAHPFGLDSLCETLAANALPVGPEMTPMLAMFQRAHDRLDPDERTLLRHLAAIDVGLTDAELLDYLGPDALDRARRLARQSMLSCADRRWRVPHTTRAFLAQSGLEDARASLDAWLAQRASALRARLPADPREVAAEWAPLVPAMRDALTRLDPSAVSALARRLARYFGLFGPREARIDVLRRAQSLTPDDLHLRVLAMLDNQTLDGDLVERALAHGGEVAVDAIRVRRALTATWLPPDTLRAILPTVSGEMEAELRVHLAQSLAWDGAAAGVHALAEARVGASGFPQHEAKALELLGGALQRAGRRAEAEGVLREGLRLARLHGLPHQAIGLERAIASGLAYQDPTAAAEAFVEVAARCEEVGITRLGAHCRCAAGVLHYAMDALERADALLARSAAGGEEAAAWAAALRLGIRVRQQEVDAEELLLDLDPDTIRAKNPDGSRVGPTLVAFLRLEVHLARSQTGRDAGPLGELADSLRRSVSEDWTVELKLMWKSLHERLEGYFSQAAFHAR